MLAREGLKVIRMNKTASFHDGLNPTQRPAFLAATTLAREGLNLLRMKIEPLVHRHGDDEPFLVSAHRHGDGEQL